MKRKQTQSAWIIRRGEYGLVGVNEAARRLRCSPTHISRVLNGKRTSARLFERFKKSNIIIEV